MSKTPIIVALLLALGLGVAAVFLLNRPGGPTSLTPVSWLAGLEANSLDSIGIEWPGSDQRAQIQREAMTGEWVVRFEGTPSVAWPIPIERLRPFLRLLADASRLPAEADTSTLRDTITLRITRRGEPPRTIKFSNSPLGGRSPAEIEDSPTARRVLVDDGLRRSLLRESLLAWRDNRAIPRSGIDASRIRVDTPTGRLSLARVQGRWGVTIPVQAPASADAATHLLRQIAALRGDQFKDDANPDDDALAIRNPSTFIRLESDLRIPRGQEFLRRTLIEEIRVGAPADLAGKSVFVGVGAKLIEPSTNKEEWAWGPTVIIMSREKLDAISSQVAPVLARRSVQFPSADAVELIVWPATTSSSPPSEPSDAEGRRFKRALSDWVLIEGAGREKALEPADALQVAGLARALCDLDCTRAATDVPRGFSPLARCRVTAMGTQGQETVTIGVVEESDGRVWLVVTAGNVSRTYEEAWVAGFVQWLKARLQPEG